MTTAIITGASSGLGACLAEELGKSHAVVNWSLETGIDVSDKKVVELTALDYDHVDILVNCAGYNYMEWITQFPASQFDLVMGANVRSILLTAKYLADKMRGGTILNIVSNASHMPMTHSAAYCASKAAAAMLTRQMAKELWQTHRITVFGISPGKMHSTRMTQQVDERAAALRNMSIEQAHDYQLSKILIGEEIDPKLVAEFAGWLLAEKHRHKHLAGCILEYGA